MSTAIYDGIFDSLNIRQVQNTDYQPNLETAVGRYSGGLDPQQINIIKGDPVISFTTTDLATVLAGISVTAGLALTSAGTITVPFQSRASGGTFLGSSSHKTLSATLGLLVPMELSASQGDKKGAQLKLELYPASSSGLANPVAMNTGATLAAQAFVGGQMVNFADVGIRVNERLPWFVGAVLGMSFLLLMIVFRSILVPLKAALLNLLSIGAAYGVVVAVFQWGWFGSLFGVESGPRFGQFAAIFGVRETSALLRRGLAGELLKAA